MNVPGINKEHAQQVDIALQAVNDPNVFPQVSGQWECEAEPERWPSLNSMIKGSTVTPDNLRPGYHATIERVSGRWAITFAPK